MTIIWVILALVAGLIIGYLHGFSVGEWYALENADDTEIDGDTTNG